MATQEYLVVFLNIWIVVLYFVSFGFLQGFKYIFDETYEFSNGLVGLPS